MILCRSLIIRSFCIRFQQNYLEGLVHNNFKKKQQKFRFSFSSIFFLCPLKKSIVKKFLSDLYVYICLKIVSFIERNFTFLAPIYLA